ncbi:MAG: hypothetical protein ACAH83_19855 [Alphaproteobacteria bacterium]
MKKEAPLLDRATLRAFLEKQTLLTVKAAQEGRFILKIPDFGDGRGPLLMPNIKELEAKMRGSDGVVTSIELEAGPQKIPADGTNVVVINRVDEFVQAALKQKLEYLIDSANGEMTRDVVNEFIGYARGYTYDANTQQITFCRNAGFRNDVYNMTNAELKKRYVRFTRQDLSLDQVKDENIRSGYYIKKPLTSRGCYLDGAFRAQVMAEAGGTMQEFSHGAMVNVPDDPTLPLSFIHTTDINTCYTLPNGWELVNADGKHDLPHFDVKDVLPPATPKKPSKARKNFPGKRR